MTLLITDRLLMYVGGFKFVGFRAENSITPSQATDDTRARMGTIFGAGAGITPICTTTGVAEMTITYTNGTPYVGAALVSMSQSAQFEVGSINLWGR